MCKKNKNKKCLEQNLDVENGALLGLPVCTVDQKWINCAGLPPGLKTTPCIQHLCLGLLCASSLSEMDKPRIQLYMWPLADVCCAKYQLQEACELTCSSEDPFDENPVK